MSIRITGCVLSAKILQTVKNGYMGCAIRAKENVHICAGTKFADARRAFPFAHGPRGMVQTFGSPSSPLMSSAQVLQTPWH